MQAKEGRPLGTRRRHYIRLLILICSMSLIACSKQSARLDLGYSSYGFDRPKIKQASIVSIAIRPFDDVRPNASDSVIGSGFTGFFGKTTPIHAKANVDSIVTAAMVEAAEKVKLLVNEDEASSDLILAGRIRYLWVQEYSTGASNEYCEGDVELDVALADGATGQILWYDIKRGHVFSEETGVDITYRDGRILNQALNGAIHAILNDRDFVAVIDQYAERKGR